MGVALLLGDRRLERPGPLLQAARRASSIDLRTAKLAIGPTLAATALQVAVDKVCEVGTVATQVSASQVNIAPPAMNFTGWATGCCSLAVTGSSRRRGGGGQRGEGGAGGRKGKELH